jgi:hypothetical protein
MSTTALTPQQIASFHKDGYVIVKNFLTPAAVEKLYSTAIGDNTMENNAINVTDQTGKNSKLSLWFTPGNDVFGYLTRSESIVNGVAALLDSDAPVCHFHSKLMQKEPKVGGAWEWH